MFLSKSKCWYSNNCLAFLKCAVPLILYIQKSHIFIVDRNRKGSFKNVPMRHQVELKIAREKKRSDVLQWPESYRRWKALEGKNMFVQKQTQMVGNWKKWFSTKAFKEEEFNIKNIIDINRLDVPEHQKLNEFKDVFQLVKKEIESYKDTWLLLILCNDSHKAAEALRYQLKSMFYFFVINLNLKCLSLAFVSCQHESHDTQLNGIQHNGS
jgi:hypothetical protein